MQMHRKDSGKICNKHVRMLAVEEEWSLKVFVNRDFSPVLNAFTLCAGECIHVFLISLKLIEKVLYRECKTPGQNIEVQT